MGYSIEEQLKKWNYDKWNSYGIHLAGSHSPHLWAQALTHFENISKNFQWETMADIGCGCPALEIEKFPQFSFIKSVIRSDGRHDIIQQIPNIRIANFNKEPLPLKDDEVELSVSFEVIEHLFSTYAFISELCRISKRGFLICKPNTDYLGVNSHWYGERNFFTCSTPLYDGSQRFEHINFIPNYELFGFGRFFNCNVWLLDSTEEEIQFFLFLKKQ